MGWLLPPVVEPEEPGWVVPEVPPLVSDLPGCVPPDEPPEPSGVVSLFFLPVLPDELDLPLLDLLPLEPPLGPRRW
ncbi:hypothetical protein [Streptomyces longwoodensis]|uniref:hypothetical protein n=1 Tax=Streptomyces TaxID=1883 RepID=UPI002F91652B|nr:hypothetical protein OG416_36960 [Streptomyces longwoodensis]